MIVDLEEPAPPIAVVGAESVEVEGRRQRIRFDGSTTSAASLVAAVAARHPLVDLSIEEPAIEDIVTDIYRAQPSQ